MTAPSPIPMRERLRIDYDWTSRQRDVLNLIARGKTNSEIGAELGISLDGAKWHVSEILSKLQAESREEAGDYWRRYNGVAPRFSRVFRGVAGALATKWVAGAAAVVVAGAATAAIVAIAINQSNDDTNAGNPDTPAPIVTPLPDTGAQPPAPAPNPAGGTTDPGTGTISFNQPVKSIPNSILYIVTGCTQCDGPDETLQKHVTDAGGSTTVSNLLKSDDGVLTGLTIGSVDASPDGALLAAVVCDRDYCGGMGQGDPKTRWQVMLSPDQGLTWGSAFTFTGNFLWVSNVTNQGFAALTVVGEEDPGIRSYAIYHRKSLRSLVPPADADPYAWQIALEDGRVLWVTEDQTRLQEEDGSQIPLRPPSGSGQLAHTPISVLDDGTLDLKWVAQTADGHYSEIVQRIDRSGTIINTFDGAGSYLLRSLTKSLAIGSVSGTRLGSVDGATSYPVLVDLSKGTATPVTSDIFTQQRGRNRFIAFQAGPFVTVKAGGDCLNVREAASTSAKSLVCYADGVLLRDLTETTTADGTTWLKVATVDGRQGWASLEFLTR